MNHLKLNVIKYMLIGFICLLMYFSFHLINPNGPKELQRVNRYIEEEVHFLNKKAGINLFGVLTYPNKNAKYPAVILISGRGQQDRDATTGKHRTFFVLADYLTRNGIAVLRFDDRGVGKSEGEFNFFTNTKEDITDDAIAAYQYLRSRPEIDVKKIGFIGHSEGGVISAMVASKISNIAFIILLACPGVNGGTSLSIQIALVGRSFGIDEAKLIKYQNILNNAMRIIISTDNKNKATLEIAKMYSFYSNQIKESERNSMRNIGYNFPENPTEFSALVMSPGWYDFFTYDPVTILKKVKCPVLALNGEKDLQVSANENLSAIKLALIQGKNKDYTIIPLPGLNHLFQSAITGSPIEYEQIEETISPIVLNTIKEWLLKRMN